MTWRIIGLQQSTEPVQLSYICSLPISSIKKHLFEVFQPLEGTIQSIFTARLYKWFVGPFLGVILSLCLQSMSIHQENTLLAVVTSSFHFQAFLACILSIDCDRSCDDSQSGFVPPSYHISTTNSLQIPRHTFQIHCWLVYRLSHRQTAVERVHFQISFRTTEIAYSCYLWNGGNAQPITACLSYAKGKYTKRDERPTQKGLKIIIWGYQEALFKIVFIEHT